MNQRFTWATCFGAVALLAACGGDGGSDVPVVVPPVPPVPVTEVPAGAAATSLAYTQYALGLTASDTAEPLGTDLVTKAPGSETDEPIVIN